MTPLNGFKVTFATIALATQLSSCGLVTGCPQTVDEAIAGTTARTRGISFVAVGRVGRFVPAADPSHRGYDLSVRRVFVGESTEPTRFLLSDEEVTGITRGAPVLILAVPIDDQAALQRGTCPPLQQISEAELVRWAGSR